MTIDQILNVVKTLRNADPCIATIFTQGGCYQFYLFINSIDQDAVPLINDKEDHVAVCLRGFVFDINGEVRNRYEYKMMTDEQIKKAETWSFSRTKYLSFGECPNCEEPLLHFEGGE